MAKARTPVGEPRHGTRSWYLNHRCRCQPCRDANTAYHRELLKRLAQTPFEQIPHGITGYRDYSCRCPACFKAQSDKNRAARERRRNAA